MSDPEIESGSKAPPAPDTAETAGAPPAPSRTPLPPRTPPPPSRQSRPPADTPVPPEGFAPEPAPPRGSLQPPAVPRELATSEPPRVPSIEPPPSIRAMRVVAISNRDSVPVIESTEAALAEFDADLSPQSIERLLAETGGYDVHDELGGELVGDEHVDAADDAHDYVEPAPDSARELSVEDLEASTTDEPPVAVEPPVTRAPAKDGPPAPPSRKPPPPRRSKPPPGRMPTAKPRARPWWETLFGDDFARAHRSPSPAQLAKQAEFIIGTLGLEQGQVLLDLGCGQGEHAVELSRYGISVVGYDLSVFQLAMAGDRAQEARQKINFLQGDMREMAFDSMFDAVLCWDTTFGYFEEDKNLEVARRILTSLKPGGSLLLDLMNRDFAARESPTNLWFEGDGCVCMDDVDLDWITSRLRVKRSLILDDGRSKELHYSLRLYTLSEIGRLLHDVGFRVAAVSGDVSTPGGFFGPASPRIIIRAERP